MKSLFPSPKALFLASSLLLNGACDREVGVTSADASPIDFNSSLNTVLPSLDDSYTDSNSVPVVVDIDNSNIVPAISGQASVFVSAVIDDSYEYGLPYDLDSGLIVERNINRANDECAELTDQMISEDDLRSIIDTCITAGNYTVARQILEQFNFNTPNSSVAIELLERLEGVEKD